jgi:hypothetical protein
LSCYSYHGLLLVLVIDLGDTTTLLLLLYGPHQNFENESNQYSVIDVFLKNSVYILLYASTYSNHESIYDVNKSEDVFLYLLWTFFITYINHNIIGTNPVYVIQIDI